MQHDILWFSQSAAKQTSEEGGPWREGGEGEGGRKEEDEQARTGSRGVAGSEEGNCVEFTYEQRKKYRKI